MAVIGRTIFHCNSCEPKHLACTKLPYNWLLWRCPVHGDIRWHWPSAETLQGEPMANAKLTATTTEATVSFADLKSRLEAKGFDWNALIQWGIKYGMSLFLPVILDLLAGNWQAAIALAQGQGQQCLADLLAALGITVPG